jgi:hypothetical protein
VRCAALAAAAALIAIAVPQATADSFNPVRLSISVAPVARLHRPLKITVGVSADPGVLDDRFAPLRMQVRLTGECGGTFQTTPGPALLNKLLSPQPATGHGYQAVAHGSGRPTSYGVKTACVYLEEEGDYRVWATSQAFTVDVSKACTTAAARYDKAVKGHRDMHTIKRDRRAARRACGPGVAL